MTSAFLGYMLGLLNPPNRRIRFRMYGGVGGAESRDSPLSRLTASWRSGYQRYIRTLSLTAADLNCLSEEAPPFTVPRASIYCLERC
jgi:hypothetical protein